MLTNDGMRASDQDRETAASLLRDAYVAGCLDLSELRDRAGAAYCARTWGDLNRLTADLPAGAALPAGAGLPGARRVAARVPEDWHEARGRMFAPVLPVGLAWLAIAAGVFAPAAVIPLCLLALAALSAVGWATRRKGAGQGKRLPGVSSALRTPIHTPPQGRSRRLEHHMAATVSMSRGCPRQMPSLTPRCPSTSRSRQLLQTRVQVIDNACRDTILYPNAPYSLNIARLPG